MNTKSEKEIDAYFNRVEDPNNYSLERWDYLIESWTLEVFRIHGETGFNNDGSYLYEMIIAELKGAYEAPIRDFINYWYVNGENLTPYMKQWHSISTKEEFDEEFSGYDSTNDDASVCVDIKEASNWNKLYITITEEMPYKMKYSYNGKQSDWIDISQAVMNKAVSKSKPRTKLWFEMIMSLCENDEFEDEDFNKENSYHANKFLKQRFLPNNKKIKDNPVTVKPQNLKSKMGLPDSRIYISSIIFSLSK